MTEAIVIYWRDIPTQVVIGKGRRGVKRQLADRFMVAVDKAAMASGAESTDAYLEEWRKVPTDVPEGAPEQVAEALAQKFEEDYPAKRLAELARQGGWEHKQQEDQ